MKIAVQLYSLREAGDFDAQLALAREAGFDWVETVATHGLAPAAFAERIAGRGLRVSSMHVGLAVLEAGFGDTVEACRLTGCPLVVMPWLPPGERPSSGPLWRAMGARLASIGVALQAKGLRLAYHNHDFEFARHEGRTALEWLFEGAAPRALGWEADLGWAWRAGADPIEWLERLADRLVAVHAKDVAPAGQAPGEDGWAALGAGVMPWRALLEHLRSRIGLVVFEHDKPRDARAVLATSRAFLRRTLGA